MKKWVVLLTIAASLGAHASIFANDQRFVIGFGLGSSSYRSDHNGEIGMEIDQGANYLYGNEMFEWYAMGNLGFGIRADSVMILDMDRSVREGSTEYEIDYQALSSQGFMLTANLVLFGSQSYARLGLIGGYGSSAYSYDVEVDVYQSGSYLDSESESVAGSGSAKLAGIYLDWGGAVFGMRLGYNDMALQYPKRNLFKATVPRKIDLSGRSKSAYLALRWAW